MTEFIAKNKFNRYINKQNSSSIKIKVVSSDTPRYSRLDAAAS